MHVHELRKKFLEFFKAKGHTVVKSDSLVPANDPTLLFTGAGMNQFKEYFMGIRKDMRRATSSQKCLRTGDLDNVGRTNYHHSFFEMLGNFSFADYFKKEAIAWAWEFLTTELKIPEAHLQVSIHYSDDEAFHIWHDDVGLAPSKIHRLGDKDNFWPSNAPTEGPNGPCGPCSEIYFDQGRDFGCGKLDCGIECDCGRFAEIWNLVFTQFDRVGYNELKPLGGKNIDTGMGLERLACVMQGKRSNFETDIFTDLIAYVKKTAELSSLAQAAVRRAVYAIVDHIRAVTFCIADGAYPSNEGRGYVIRKLIRRAVWLGRSLGVRKPFLAPMVAILGTTMGDQYPEIVEQRSEIEQMVTGEESRFLTTLEEGVTRLDGMIAETKKADKAQLCGEDVFRLYDTYGFPAELTADIAEESGLTIDLQGFNTCMEAQREKARQASKISGAVFDISQAEVAIAKLPATVFLGYETEQAEDCLLLKVIRETGSDEAVNYEQVLIVLDKTPFYAESGGQVGDTGILKNGNYEITVTDTYKVGEVFVHKGTVPLTQSGAVSDGDIVSAIVSPRRRSIMRNHTATHLLQAALRQVLGPQVRQFGSEVREDKFRFDFSFQRALTAQEIEQVEALVNKKITEGIAVKKEEKGIDEARCEGATALFGEKYGDVVRVVTIDTFSKELCGGTHVDNTKDIGLFTIVKESSISSGTRRIEGMTADAAQEYRAAQQAQVQALEAKRAEKEKQKQEKESKIGTLVSGSLVDEIIAAPLAGHPWPGVAVYARALHDVSRDGLLAVTDALKGKLTGAYVVILCGWDAAAGKTAGVVAAADEVVKQGTAAGAVAKYCAGKTGGSGGGKPVMAFFGGSREIQQEELETWVKEYR